MHPFLTIHTINTIPSILPSLDDLIIVGPKAHHSNFDDD